MWYRFLKWSHVYTWEKLKTIKQTANLKAAKKRNYYIDSWNLHSSIGTLGKQLKWCLPCVQEKICQVRTQSSARDYRKSKWHHSCEQMYRISSSEAKGTLKPRGEQLPLKQMVSMWTNLNTWVQYEPIMQRSLPCSIWCFSAMWLHFVSLSLSASPFAAVIHPFVSGLWNNLSQWSSVGLKRTPEHEGTEGCTHVML